jgi:diguanylate cyclase
MLKKFARGLSVAVQVAVVGFDKAFNADESIESILGLLDPLTRIPNRKAFEQERESFAGGYSLIMVDIDNFKKINDTRGHAHGDQVLRRLAAILKDVVAPNGRAYRIAGDEFFCIVPQWQVVSACEAIRNSLRQDDEFTVSQGVVMTFTNGLTHEVVTQADAALYRSKAEGRNTVMMAAIAA